MPPAGELKGHVLVVDDNPTNRDLLTRRLQRMGLTTDEAEDGAQALEKMKQTEYDTVLLDIMMPNMNGYQVLEHLKADGRVADIPVIMITAVDSIESIVKCVQLGAVDYLSKPFNREILQARLTSCLERRHLRGAEKRYMSQIEAEKKRSNELLHVILPDKIAEELMTTGKVKPRRYDDVAVLFSDIVGFTSYCDKNPPELVVDFLQHLTEAFEEKALQFGVHKTKTIGDAFMATSGLLHPDENPVLSCVRFGLEMVNLTKKIAPMWQLRVGIHVGPVMAGIVGKRQYLFDLWGDTVNTAQRVESASESNTVCLSAAAWERVSNYCKGTSLGLRGAKGKGDIEVYRIDEVLAG